jgi:tRNA (guanine37-N1)-methyltransferase
MSSELNLALRFDVITLFPELIAGFIEQGVIRRAFTSGAAQLHCWNPRDFTHDVHKTVDDRPYGGGPGMVMLAEPLHAALQAITAARGNIKPHVILFSPAGAPLKQERVQSLALGQGVVLICGRYEGVDQRFIDAYVDEEISLGDFVLSGGEVAAMALIDACTRLLPGVLNDAQSAIQESFSAEQDGLLDTPHYTRPEQWQGHAVPAILLSGNHAKIAEWRREQQLKLTRERRPDLLSDQSNDKSG